MNRILFAALAVAMVCAAPTRADDKPADKPAEKKDRAEQLKDLQADFQKVFPDVVKEWREAKGEAEKDKALAKLDPLVERGYKIVSEDPKDDTAFDTLLFLMRTRPEPPAKVMDLLAEHHINNRRLGAMMPQFASNPSAGAQKLLKTAMEKSTSKDVKGIATYALAQSIHSKAEGVKDEKENAKLTKQAEDLLDVTVKDYADVKMGGSTLKELAGKTLFEIRNLSVGKTAPEVVSKDLDEKPTKLSALKGKVVVLDIWATWCGPCRAMIPHEREMVEKLKDKPFTLISISADDKKETLTEFLEKEKMPWTHWWEGRHPGGILNDWNVRFFPTIYVIDAKGVIRHKGLRGKELEDAVEKLLKEMEKKS